MLCYVVLVPIFALYCSIIDTPRSYSVLSILLGTLEGCVVSGMPDCLHSLSSTRTLRQILKLADHDVRQLYFFDFSEFFFCKRILLSLVHGRRSNRWCICSICYEGPLALFGLLLQTIDLWFLWMLGSHNVFIFRKWISFFSHCCYLHKRNSSLLVYLK